MSCDFAVQVSIVAADETTVQVNLEDEANGLTILNEIAPPEWDEAQGRVSSPYMHGDAPTGLPTIVTGFLPVTVEVTGATWAQTAARVEALSAAWRAEPQFFLDVALEGVTTRYRAERSLWRPGPVTAEHLHYKRQEVALVFRVQPKPTVTYAP